MDGSAKIIIDGREHEAKGEIHCDTLEAFQVALGTSVGITSKPNEDAAGVAIQDTEMILAIADGHWGREASEISVSKAMELLDPESRLSNEMENQAKLISLFEQVNDYLYGLAASSPDSVTPETTLIVCQIKEVDGSKFLHWASFGDSYLFLLRKERLKQLNSLHPRWLGYLSKLSDKAETRSLLMKYLANEARYVGVAGGLETGLENLESGDIVFLCTDGLLGSDRDPDLSVLNGIQKILASDLPMVAKVEKAIAGALARGEKDNISCLAALIP